jgi:hypothetical protein
MEEEKPQSGTSEAKPNITSGSVHNEKPEHLIHPGPSEASHVKEDDEDDDDDEDENENEVYEELQRIRTSKSLARQQTFQPISIGDPEALQRIASNFHNVNGTLTRISTKTNGDELQRKDTLYGVKIGDPVLDPGSNQFDPYKWSRM